MEFRKMKIRKIQNSDVEQCSKILERAYTQPPYKEKFNKGMALLYVKSKYKNCNEHSFVMVDNNENILAFAFCSISAWTNGLQAMIEEIVVDTGLQNNGIGTNLLDHISEYLISKNIKSIMLWAHKAKNLQAFYKNNGYSVAEDFTVMFRDL